MAMAGGWRQLQKVLRERRQKIWSWMRQPPLHPHVIEDVVTASLGAAELPASDLKRLKS